MGIQDLWQSQTVQYTSPSLAAIAFGFLKYLESGTSEDGNEGEGEGLVADGEPTNEIMLLGCLLTRPRNEWVIW